MSPPPWIGTGFVALKRQVFFRTTRKGVEHLVKWKDLSYVRATWESLGEECGLKTAPQAIKEYEDLRRLMDPKKKEKKRGRKPKVVIEVSQKAFTVKPCDVQ